MDVNIDTIMKTIKKMVSDIFRENVKNEEQTEKLISYINDHYYISENSFDSIIKAFEYKDESNLYKVNNENNIRKVFERIVELSEKYKLKYNNREIIEEIIFDEKYKNICNMLIYIPVIGEVHGGYLYELYSDDCCNSITYCSKDVWDCKHIPPEFIDKLDCDFDKNFYKKYQRIKKQIMDRRDDDSPITKLLNRWHVNYDKTKQDYNKFCDILEYIMYTKDTKTQISSTKGYDTKHWTAEKNNMSKNKNDVKSANNVSLLLDKPTYSLFLNTLFYNNIDFPLEIKHHQNNIRFLLTEIKRKCKLEEVYNYSRWINKWLLAEYSYRNEYIGKIIQKITVDPTLMQYPNDESVANYYISYKKILKDIDTKCNIESKSDNYTNGFWVQILLGLLKEKLKLQFLMVKNCIDYSNIIVEPLEEKQKKAFIKLYNFLDPVKTLEEIKTLLKDNIEDVKIFMNVQDISAVNKYYNKAVDLWENKLYEIQQWNEEKSIDKCDVGYFLSIMQILNSMDDMSVDIEYYQKKRGKETKLLATLLKRYKNNDYEEIHQFFREVFRARYSSNIGWNKAWKEAQQCRILMNELAVKAMENVMSFDDMEDCFNKFEITMEEVRYNVDYNYYDLEKTDPIIYAYLCPGVNGIYYCENKKCEIIIRNYSTISIENEMGMVCKWNIKLQEIVDAKDLPNGEMYNFMMDVDGSHMIIVSYYDSSIDKSVIEIGHTKESFQMLAVKIY
ncbi:hypothetical protein [Pectinatus frisingensis]|uniref:hypothetical protein n=1 Tax=Pectinatus frisingensis TaxID=865 RepID=UPI0018C468A4|nr:hypothetical protein [Pectinatus frisingensis]